MAKDSNSSTSVTKALTGPLQIITLCTNNLESIKKFYVEGLGMEIDGPFDLDSETILQLRTYWHIPETIEFQVFQLQQKLEYDELVSIRLLVLSEDTETIHSSSAHKEVGPYSIGFLRKNIKEGKEILKNQGQASLSNAHLKEAHATDKKEEERKVSLFSGPDHVRASLVEGESLGLQFATFITDRPDEEIEFYTHVLGMQLIADYQGKSKIGSGRDDSNGIIFRSSRLRSKAGANSAVHLLSYETPYEEREVAFRLPHRGITMYSFMTKDIGEILARAHAKEIKVYRTPRKLVDPIFGEAIVMSLLSPTGFIVEVYNPT